MIQQHRSAEALAQFGGEHLTQQLAALARPATALTVREAIDAYMREYRGRDSSRTQRLAAWIALIGDRPLAAIDSRLIRAAREAIAQQPALSYKGLDFDGRPIFKPKANAKRKDAATLNRYVTALSAVFTWALEQELVPADWRHPCRGVKRGTRTCRRNPCRTRPTQRRWRFNRSRNPSASSRAATARSAPRRRSPSSRSARAPRSRNRPPVARGRPRCADRGRRLAPPSARPATRPGPSFFAFAKARLESSRTRAHPPFFLNGVLLVFWIALLAFALAVVVFRLGALSVWAALLSAAWKSAVGLAVLAFVGWRFVAR